MDSMSFWTSLLKMLFSLALVLGLLVGALYMFRRLMQKTASGAEDQRAINVVATRYLGPKCSIMVVDVLGKIIVIGLADNQMSRLATISDGSALEKLKYMAGPEKKLPPLADYLVNHRVVKDLKRRWHKEGQEA